MRQCDCKCDGASAHNNQTRIQAENKKNCNVRVMRRDDSEHCISSNVVTKMW